MRVLVACKRGGIAPRSKSGHCLCEACISFRRGQWREQNHRRKEARLEWQRQNPEKVKSYSRKWTGENPEKRKAAVISWRQRNPDAVKTMNAKAGSKWARNNKAAKNTITRRRQIAKIKRTPIWADHERIRAVYAEAVRMTDETGIPHEVDHILPLQGKTVCGLHVENNLRVVPQSINRSKQNKVEPFNAT